MRLKKLLRGSAGFLSEKLLAIFSPQFVPFSGKVLEQFYIYKLRKQEFPAVRAFCIRLAGRPALSEKLKKISSDYFCKANLDNNPDIFVLDKLATSYQKKTIQSLESLAGKNIDEARKHFIIALDSAGIPGVARHKLAGVFELLAGQCPGNNDVSFFGEAQHGSVQTSGKIILSGMNWSGTGALYDFFREFSGVRALPGEQRLWKESDYSLLWGLNNLEKLDTEGFYEYLKRLFLIPMTGLSLPRNI